MDCGTCRTLRGLRHGLLHRCRATIHRDEVRIDKAYLAVFGLNAGEVKAINEDREALAAG